MDSALTFVPWHGPVSGLYVDKNYMVFKWAGPGHILASVARRGDAVSAHLSCDKLGLRHLKQAINDFCVFAAEEFTWCRMVLAQCTKGSVCRIVVKCGFFHVGNDGNITVYARKV